MAENKKVADNKDIFVDHVVSLRRVTKVTKGGKRFAFSALVISGNKAGQVGIGQGSGLEVSLAINKATRRARMRMITVPLRGETLPYGTKGRHGASRVLLRPASEGTGVIAGGAVRPIMEAAGVKNVLAKSLGSGNRLNVVKATFNALAQMRSAEHIAKLRGKTVKQLVRGDENATVDS